MWEKSVIVACPTLKMLFIFSITSSGYHVAIAKTQRRFSSHCCTCIIMRIQPTTVKQLSSSLEIQMAQVVRKYIQCNNYNVIIIIKKNKKYIYIYICIYK